MWMTAVFRALGWALRGSVVAVGRRWRVGMVVIGSAGCWGMVVRADVRGVNEDAGGVGMIGDEAGPKLIRRAERELSMRFEFGNGRAEGADAGRAGVIDITPQTAYTDARGYGVLPLGELRVEEMEGGRGALVSDAGFLLAMRLGEGNYRVTVELGGARGGSVTTVKAEARRLMIAEQRVEAGRVVSNRFVVNVRTPRLSEGGAVQINEREEGSATWDDRLTLEFLGERPAVLSVEIERLPDDSSDVVQMFLAGDSTVVDGLNEPWTGWGQMLPAMFDERVVVSNHAESGRALRSFRAQRRLDKIMESIRPGDVMLIQFGHNDMKEKGEGIGPFTSFSEDLRSYVRAVRAKQAHPVLVTPMYRRRFEDGRLVNTHGDYPEAVRRVARELNAPLIDLHEQSCVLFEALGPETSRSAFVHYPANTFPGQVEALKDDSHFSPYGGHLLARIVLDGLRTSGLPIVESIRADVPVFDPSHPPSPEQWTVPASSIFDVSRPEGN